MKLDFIAVKIGGHDHRIARPVADELGIIDGESLPDGDPILDRVIGLNSQLIRAQSDRLRRQMDAAGLTHRRKSDTD